MAGHMSKKWGCKHGISLKRAGFDQLKACDTSPLEPLDEAFATI